VELLSGDKGDINDELSLQVPASVQLTLTFLFLHSAAASADKPLPPEHGWSIELVDTSVRIGFFGTIFP
jgi:hypothetical protein